MSADLTRALEQEARRVGFSLFGVTAPKTSTHLPFYEEWLEHGHHGGMTYLAGDRAVARRGDLRETMDAVRSVVVVADGYLRGEPGAEDADADHGIIARYARGRDYHAVVGRKLRDLGRWLDTAVPGGVRSRAYVDTGPILERDLARRAGLGWFGRNTMLISPRKGSYFFLGLLLVDVELESSQPFEADRCGTCRSCLDACPTGALLGRDSDGAPVMDARRCISYLTIEHRGPIPENFRPAIGNRVYGCDICQEVCPFNRRFAEESTEPDYAARGPGQRPVGVEAIAADTGGPDHPGTATPRLTDLLRTALDESTWERFSRGSAIRRAGRAGFARNVCVALGNAAHQTDTLDPVARALLAAALEDEDATVRDAAGWALSRGT